MGRRRRLRKCATQLRENHRAPANGSKNRPGQPRDRHFAGRRVQTFFRKKHGWRGPKTALRIAKPLYAGSNPVLTSESSRQLSAPATFLIGLGDAPPDLARDLLKKTGVADGSELKRITGVVEKLASGAMKVRRKVENPRSLRTVQDLGEVCGCGTLAKEHPDQIHRRRSERDDEIRLGRHVHPVVGAVRVRDLTVEECETVMRSL